ncbi:MAG: proton-conducting membrane transporter [Halanaeroarchaeum sp.]
MTSRPEFASDIDLFPGLVAGVLFVVMAALFVGANFAGSPGFPEGARITASMGYALFNLDVGSMVASEGFLAAFEIIDVVLVAALVAAVMLARRPGGSILDVLQRGER